ncbi:aminoglycoside phosphotransferase [Rhizoctonia solani AG-1 IB]|uniref:Aminoglycoside phosphotransferase n=1 Tax=Thanatephorus cucumeris (strain AG1-IB / isolate 7/3/14) TaxID=1108050 RepID=M5CC75_THACB|nr:aminoglycoside phosphotransferase [Rhizoctonia solani AG-1 IB]
MTNEITSVTKYRLSGSQIRDIATEFYVNSPQRLEIKEFTSGCYNAAYHVVTEHGQWVLKVAPKPTVKVLRYEHNILDAEVRVLNILSNYTTPLRIPKVHRFDQRCKLIEAPYAIIDYIPGENLDKVRKELDKNDERRIDQAMGRHLRFCNEITRSNSGDDRPDGSISEFGLCAIDAPRYPTWREAFDAFITSLLADAQDASVPDIPHDEIQQLLTLHASAFDEVNEPRLVVWDQWDGNVLISFADQSNKQGGSVSGTIDYERALWGDPLMETTFRALKAPVALVEAYGAYKPEELTTSQRIRRMFYDLHLSLIWVIEVTFRGIQELEHGGKDMEGYGRMGIQMSLEGLRALARGK